MEPLKTVSTGVTAVEKSKETSNSNSIYTVSPSTHISTTTSQVPYIRVIQNFRLVWLDSSIDEVNNDGSINTITTLREAVNAVNKFTDVDECINFITDIEDEKIFMIFCGEFGQTIIPIVHDIEQINCVYIFCEDKAQHEQWTTKWPKVKGVFTDISSICEALKKAAQVCDHNSVSLSFIAPNDGVTNQNLNQLDQSFMYTQILKEILLTIDFGQEYINEFVIYCREQFAGNSAEINNVNKFEKEYRHHEPIWWYTYQGFLYSMLNRALRMMEVDLIIKMGFFLQDLHNDIAALHIKQYSGHHHSNSFTVYRGQGLSQIDFDQVLRTKDGLLSFNNFLSTSLDRAVSLAFTESNQYNPDFMGVLFEITVNSSISSTSFAKISDASYYRGEEEILFSMHSVFRIGQIQQLNGNTRLWQVNLTLTSDNDPQLHALTERIRAETFPVYKGWHRLGVLLIKLGQLNKAEGLYEILLKQATSEDEKGHVLYQLGCIKTNQGRYEEAIILDEKSLEIYQKILPSNHPLFASSFDNIGTVYNLMGERLKALSYYKKALGIRQETLPPNHSDFAHSYNNIGGVYSNMAEYTKALFYHEKALEIRQKTLPENHPGLATTYNNLASLYFKIGEYSKALLYYEKALEIRRRTLPTNHPDLADTYNNIGLVCNNIGEYSKALSYYEKAIGIRQKTLSPNHPDLATSYNNIGFLYNNIGEYSKALSFYEKALEIRQKTLSPNHPDLATSYNNIGLLYNNTGEYSKALLYYEKDLEICRKTLHANHPDLSISYNNIGWAYRNMSDYSKALSYYERALDILQHSLPPNHPHLQSVWQSIQTLKEKL